MLHADGPRSTLAKLRFLYDVWLLLGAVRLLMRMWRLLLRGLPVFKVWAMRSWVFWLAAQADGGFALQVEVMISRGELHRGGICGPAVRPYCS